MAAGGFSSKRAARVRGPLLHQPGERWMYDTAADITGVPIARAAGRSLGDALRGRICDPRPGHYGTAWYNDPAEDLVAIVMMQRPHAGDQKLPMWADLWTAIYQPIDD